MQVLEKEKTQTREVVIVTWYEEVFPKVAIYIKRRGGNLEEAKEIFQESIVSLYEKLMDENFVNPEDKPAYLMGIAKKKWMKYQERAKLLESLQYMDVLDENEPQPVIQKLLVHLRQAGEKCMDLLQSFYYEKLTMKQIAERYVYKSERSATVQKYKCLEKVRDTVKQKSLSYEDFFE